MRTIRVERSLKASAERVFEVLADHAGYAAFPGILSSKVTRPGTDEPNGVGAIRLIHMKGAWFEEEITVFERPRQLGYRIVKSRPPIEHRGGLVELTPTATGCDVRVTSTFRITTPVVGGLLTWIAARKITRLFGDALAQVDASAAAAASAG